MKVTLSILAASCALLVIDPALARGTALPGVPNEQRAWQNWALNCQGCHSPDGEGFPNATPRMANEVAKFLSVPGGREYLVQVPGVSTAPLGDAELAELMNWMLPRLDPEHMPQDFKPYTAAEVKELKKHILRTEANRRRAELLATMPALSN